LRVVREGIAAEDWVVVRGLQRARPGIKVDMKQTSIALSPVSPVNKTAE
jgi:multidrug efflux system membrane fusion protein